MNQPVEDRFKKIEEEQRHLRAEQEAIKKRIEQKTEPIPVTRVEVASADVEHRLDDHTDLLNGISQKQDKFSSDIEELKLDARAYVGDAAIFKNKVEHIEIDMSTVKKDVSILKSDVGTLKTDVSTLKTDMEQVKTVQSGHTKYFEQHGKRLSQIETDVSGLKTDVSSIKSTQEQILKILQQKDK
jgi:chromosome segregation ATPase